MLTSRLVNWYRPCFQIDKRQHGFWFLQSTSYRKTQTNPWQISGRRPNLKGPQHPWFFGVRLIQEMLQNAEDAGASEVRFVLDPSSFSREKIMAPIAGKNDLGRMQVNDWTYPLEISMRFFAKQIPHCPIFSSKLPCWIARKKFC